MVGKAKYLSIDSNADITNIDSDADYFWYIILLRIGNLQLVAKLQELQNKVSVTATFRFSRTQGLLLKHLFIASSEYYLHLLKGSK